MNKTMKSTVNKIQRRTLGAVVASWTQDGIHVGVLGLHRQAIVTVWANVAFGCSRVVRVRAGRAFL